MPVLDTTHPENRTAAPAVNGSKLPGVHLSTSHPEERENPAVTNELDRTVTRHARSRPKVLVVDDEAEVLRSVQNLLRMDYQVVTSESGSQALCALREDPEISVILSDQRMPGMSGVEVLHQAQEIRPETTRLLFTAHSDIRAVIDAINKGHVFRYIAKPWEPDELEAVIRQAVERRDLIVEKNRLVAELQMANAKLVEANRLKTSFLEVASHELNTPVTVVLGLTDLWSMSLGCDCKGPERQWVERIQTAALRLAKTVHRMFKLVRCNKFSQALEIETVHLEPLIEQAVDALRPYLLSRGQSIVVQVDPALGSIEADASKLSDVMINLLANAIKFTSDQGTIRIFGHALEGQHDWVRVAVEDEGVGVPRGEQPYLFEPFFTGFDTLHHSSGEYQFCKRGIGLGLSLVKTFIELHGGRVDFQSAPDRGSTFEFVVPRHQPAHGNNGHSEPAENPPIRAALPEDGRSAWPLERS
jgi:signal transduction histidine kinase